MFCLYLQYKGKLDPGVSEFRGDGYFRKFDHILEHEINKTQRCMYIEMIAYKLTF